MYSCIMYIIGAVFFIRYVSVYFLISTTCACTACGRETCQVLVVIVVTVAVVVVIIVVRRVDDRRPP